MLDTTVFHDNNAAIETALATIAAAYAANKAALAVAGQTVFSATDMNANRVVGQLATNYPAEIAKAMCAAGLTDVVAAGREGAIDRLNNLTINGAGGTGLTGAWVARIAAGQLGPHT